MIWLSPSLSVIRLIADLSLLASFPVLWFRMRKNGYQDISLVTQVLQLVVFITRYLDVFGLYISFYNTSLKVAFTLSAAASVYLVYSHYPAFTVADRTHFYRQIAQWTFPALMLSLVVNYVGFTPFMFSLATTSVYRWAKEIFWAFSIYLAVVAFVPQLVALERATVVDRELLVYLALVFSFRALYIPHWILRYIDAGGVDPIGVSSGVMQVIVMVVIGVRSFIRRRNWVLSGGDTNDSEATTVVDDKVVLVDV